MNKVLSSLVILVWFIGCSELEEPCLLGEIEVTTGECVTDSTFQVTLSFNYLNAKNDFFEVFNREEESVGFFKLSDLPVTINNFRISGNDLEYLKVCINDNPDCCEIAEFQAPDCESQECAIGDLILDPSECTGENTYNLYLNFEYENADNELFNVYGREDKLIGTYHLSALPITIENFEGSGGDYDFIKVSINDHPDCFKVAEFQAPVCENQECAIGDLILDPGECTGENTYNLYLNFEYENADNDLFNVYGREDKLIGTYHLFELPITIENFEGSGGDYDFIKVSINDHPDCFKVAEFQAPVCESQECAIGDLILDPAECTGENTYNLYLNFEYENADNDLFNVYGREDKLIGTYQLSALPITIENFEGSGGDYDFIKVGINDHPDCFKVAEFQAPVCESQECAIGDLILDPADCTGENTYNLYLNFEYENAGNDLFNVYGREDKLIGTYHLSALPITIENFEGSGGDYDFIKVSINDHPDCFKVAEFQAPVCESQECAIGDLILDPAECTGENTYNLYLNFEYENAGNDLFNVYGREDKLIGTYQLSALPITIENFEGSGGDYDFIKVSINDQPDCFKVAEFQAPDCQ